MSKLKSSFEFILLTFKTFPMFWRASKIYTILLGITIPLQGLIPVGTVIVTKFIVDIIATGNQGADSYILIFLLLWIILSIISAIINPINTLVQGLMTDKLIAHINFLLMEKSGEIKDLGIFENPDFYDDVKVIQDEAAWRPVNLMVFVASIIRNFLTTTSMIILLVNFHFIIAIAILLSLLPQALIIYRLQQEAFENMVTRSADSRKLKYYSTILLTKEYAKEARMFNYASFFIEKYKSIFDTIYSESRRIKVRQSMVSILFSIVGAVGSAICFYWVIMKSLNGEFTAGDILLFSTTILLASKSIIEIIQESSLLYDTLLYMKKFNSLINLPSSIEEGDWKVQDNKINSIEFKNVDFIYPFSKEVILHDLSFFINENEKVALVGENGSGKTTIVKLLTRMYEPTKGEILVNGLNIKKYNIDNLRGVMSILFQDFSKYDLTLRENIGLSNYCELGNDDLIQYAIEKSGVDSFVNQLDNKYNQVLGKNFEGGTDLSGGQWQKVATARALFKISSLIILDEPSSTLDARSEHVFFQTLEKNIKNKTMILITHRLSNIKMVDKIILLQKGKAINIGSHKELYEHNSYYKDFYNMQADKYRDD